MACLLTDGILKGCRDNIGGIDKVWLTNLEHISAITYGTGILTALSTQNPLGTSAASFYEFQPNKTSSNWTDTISVVASNGGTFYAPSVTLVFGKLEAAKANTIKLMGQGTLVCLVKNNDGKYFILGDTKGLEVSAGAGASGVAYTDLNGWTITLTGAEDHPAYEVPSALMTSSILLPAV